MKKAVLREKLAKERDEITEEQVQAVAVAIVEQAKEEDKSVEEATEEGFTITVDEPVEETQEEIEEYAEYYGVPDTCCYATAKKEGEEGSQCIPYKKSEVIQINY